MSLLHKDTTFTKIFVGGLPYHTTDETLRKFFERFGDIEEAVVITDRQTGKSRGYGFVTMNTQEAASLATREPNPVIDGRKANVNLAYLGAKPRVIPSPAGLIPLHLAGAYSAALPAPYGIQPIYYQQPTTTAAAAAAAANAQTPTTATLLATTSGTPTLSTLLPNPTSNQGTNVPSYYELTYAAASTIDPTSYIYTTATGQTFSYASLPPSATTNATALNDIYGNHAAIDRDHQRTTAGW